jgi:hypothetical protein
MFSMFSMFSMFFSSLKNIIKRNKYNGPGSGSGTIGGKYYHCQFNCKDGTKSPWLHWSYPAPAKYSDFCIDAPPGHP